MTDGKTRTIRRWNDSRIGENPIRFLPPAIILARKHRWLGHTVPRRAALRAHQGVRHFNGPATLSSAHAQLVAGMQIIREITCEHKETQPQVLLPELGLFCS